MAKAKAGRATKQMLGQFMTPPDLAAQVIDASGVVWKKDAVILEPGFGKGAFLFQAIEGLLDAHGSRSRKVIDSLFSNQIYGVEMDPELYAVSYTHLTLPTILRV